MCTRETPHPMTSNTQPTLVDVIVGLCSTNSCVSQSYVAVVSRPRTNVPWPSSVCASMTRNKARRNAHQRMQNAVRWGQIQ